MKRVTLTLLLLLTSVSMLLSETQYRLRWDNPQTFTYLIDMECEPVSGEFTEFHLPVWRPGRYILQDYAGSVSGFEATNAKGKKLSWAKTSKSTWRVQNPESGNMRISYRMYAKNLDAGSSYVDAKLAYFNGANLFMYVQERINEPCLIEFPAVPKKWTFATALPVVDAKKNQFRCKSYHQLADSPTLISEDLTKFSFEHEGVTFFLHFYQYAAPEGAEKVLIENVRKIVQEQHALFGSWPFEEKEYHFIYLLLPFNMRHAVEHANSAMFALPQSVATSAESFSGLYGITSHEFWHIWNVKTIRPAALLPYDYRAEQYTGLHWFTEGVTDYYTDLTLVRAGIMSEEAYIADVSRTLSILNIMPQAKRVSPHEGSWDSWIDPSNYKDPNQKLSYYLTGSRIGFLLDLEIRRQTEGQKSLDDVFRYLHTNFGQKGIGVPEDGIEKAIEASCGLNLKDFFNKYIYTTEPVDIEKQIKGFGLKVQIAPTPDQVCTYRLGILKGELNQEGYVIKNLMTESVLWEAGLAEDDVILTFNGEPASVSYNQLDCEAGKSIKIEYRRLFDSYETKCKPDLKKEAHQVVLQVNEPENAWLRGWLAPNFKP